MGLECVAPGGSGPTAPSGAAPWLQKRRLARMASRRGCSQGERRTARAWRRHQRHGGRRSRRPGSGWPVRSSALSASLGLPRPAADDRYRCSGGRGAAREHVRRAQREAEEMVRRRDRSGGCRRGPVPAGAPSRPRRRLGGACTHRHGLSATGSSGWFPLATQADVPLGVSTRADPHGRQRRGGCTGRRAGNRAGSDCGQLTLAAVIAARLAHRVLGAAAGGSGWRFGPSGLPRTPPSGSAHPGDRTDMPAAVAGIPLFPFPAGRRDRGQLLNQFVPAVRTAMPSVVSLPRGTAFAGETVIGTSCGATGGRSLHPAGTRHVFPGHTPRT